MMSMFLNEATKLRAETIIKGLEKRNMHGVFCATKEDALKQALSYIKEGSSVSWGGSMSVSEIGLMDALKEGNYHLIVLLQRILMSSVRSFLRLSYLIIS